MCGKCYSRTWQRAITLSVLFLCIVSAGCKTVNKPINAGLQQPDSQKNDFRGSEENEEAFGQGEKTSLPSAAQLLEAKLLALQVKQTEQEQILAEVELKLLEEQKKGKEIFDSHAYLSLSIINSAPPKDYRLEYTKIYVDKKLVAQGGKRNRGLPRKLEVFFGPVAPGCHDLVVKAQYVRLKNDLISRYKVNRVEYTIARQTFVAKNGHQLNIEIEGYEAHNTFANFYRGPALRFNKSARPNFLPGTPLISLEEIFNQGRVYVDYVTEDAFTYRTIEKSLSIDGLPVLVNEKHNFLNGNTIIFDGPLAEGKHTLSVSLMLGKNNWVGGGPLYNFRMKYDRDFYVLSGQDTVINLKGMPKDGFRSEPENTRYVSASSQILSRENEEFFPEYTCKEIIATEKAELEKIKALESKANKEKALQLNAKEKKIAGE